MSRRRVGMSKNSDQQQESRSSSNSNQTPDNYTSSNIRDQCWPGQSNEFAYEGIPLHMTRERHNVREFQQPLVSEPPWTDLDSSPRGWSNEGVSVRPFPESEHLPSPYLSPVGSGHHQGDSQNNPQSPYIMVQGQNRPDNSTTRYDSTQYPQWNHPTYPAVGYPHNVRAVPPHVPEARKPAPNLYIRQNGEVPADSPSPLHGNMQALSLEETQTDLIFTCPKGCGAEFRGVHSKGNLTRHGKSCPNSEKEKTRIRCEVPYCGKDFARSDGLRVHMRKHHQGYGAPTE